MLPWHQYLLGILFILAGINHFRKPKLYKRIMPLYIPAHDTMIILSGIAEMLLGFMILNPETQSMSAWGLIAMLLLFVPVHIYMLQNEKAAMKLPKWVLILRLPLQFLLIFWVYQYV